MEDVMKMIVAAAVMDFVQSGATKSERFFVDEDFLSDDPIVLPDGMAVRVTFDYVPADNLLEL